MDSENDKYWRARVEKAEAERDRWKTDYDWLQNLFDEVILERNALSTELKELKAKQNG